MPSYYEKPSDRLTVELDEAQRDASQLQLYLENINFPLPPNFPKKVIIELCKLMRDLPEGTAHGCREPLLFAQEKLAALRGEFIQLEDAADASADDLNPRLLRREALDDRITALMSSVSTALQAANREIAASIEAGELPEPAVEPPRDGAAKRVSNAVRKGQKRVLAQRDELDSMRVQGSTNADRLRRRLTDTLSLNRVASTELAMPKIVPAWLSRIGAALREYPKLIVAASATMKVSADIADWAHDKWSNYNNKLFKFGTEMIREISVDLSRYGRDLEEYRRRGLSATATNNFSEAQARELILSGKPIPSEWQSLVTHLDLQNNRISDITRLKGLDNLRSLLLSHTYVSDLSPLISLRKLQWLQISRTKVVDINPISFIHSLIRLDLDGLQISDIDPLGTLVNLMQLDLSRTEVKELTPIYGFKNLRNLDVSHTPVFDIRCLRLLPTLVRLDLSFTLVHEVGPLTGLHSLRELHLSGTKVDAHELTQFPLPFLERLVEYSPP